MDLRELYQETIIEHGRRPRNCCVIDNPDRMAEGYNPVCGDKLTVYLNLSQEQKIEKLTFVGQGCAISMASASLMTEALLGKTVIEAEHIFKAFRTVVTNDVHPDPSIELGKLKVLEGVKAYPSRVKCATLAWHTLHNALHGDTYTIANTERCDG